MADEDVYYSALHYAAKAKKYAEQTKDVKEEADQVIALVEGFDGTVDAAKTAIINLSDEKKTEIRNEGTAQVTAVSDEGTKQVGLVNTASATAQQQIAAQSTNFVTLDGSQTVTGTKFFSAEPQRKSSTIDITTAAEQYTSNNAFGFQDKNGRDMGHLENAQTTDGIVTSVMAKNKSSYQASVGVFVPQEGQSGAYGIAPTPPASAQSNEIATAEWVLKDVQPLINAISETSGSIALEVNKIYSMAISDATTFTLPESVDTTRFNQIKVMATVTGTPTITWGTTNFFNKTTPEIEEGSYDFYFDYDNGLGAWVAGALSKGAAS